MAEGGRGRQEPFPQQVALLTQFVAGPGRADFVRDALLQLVGPTRAEAGNLSYDVHQLKNNPAAFYVLSNWRDQSALETHLTSAHIRMAAERAGPDLVAPFTVWRARMLSRPDTDPNRPRPVGGSSDQITLLPFFPVRSGEEEAVLRSSLEMVELTRTERGCLGYDLYASADDPSLMFLYENWADQAALDKHMNTSHFYRLVRGEIDRRLSAPWTAHTMTMVSQPRVERVIA